MPVKRMQDTDWEVLMKRIKDGRCTPFLGAGVYSEGPSLRTSVAKKWAVEKNYPFSDSDDVARVARYLNVVYGDAEYASGKYADELSKSRCRTSMIQTSPTTYSQSFRSRFTSRQITT